MRLRFRYEEYPYAEVFRISRSASVNTGVFVAEVSDGVYTGRGECSTLEQYGQTREDVLTAFEAAVALLAAGMGRADLPAMVSNSSVRNAIDCALWDLECKSQQRSIWELTGIQRADSLPVDITLGINSVDKMQSDAEAAYAAGYRLLKIKADADQVLPRVAAIAAVAPGVPLIVDANEAWSIAQLAALAPELSELGVVLIEQPLSHLADEALADYRGPIPLCADESCQSAAQLDVLQQRYQSINIKLDKVGGLTPALALARAAKQRGLGLMMGCGGPTSLGIAPAYVVGTLADYCDLDGPALLREDRADAVEYRNGRLLCFTAALWG
ncbi:MAG: dipeptide epimerase [Haliea sp.]|jgi:L-Ala-D/L-Glu epimerase